MTVETLRFSTEAASVHAYGRIYAPGSDVSPFGRHATSNVVVRRFPRLILFERQSVGLAHVRTPARVRQDGNDHLSIHLLLAGILEGGPLGATRRLGPGDILLFDTSQPQWSQAHDAHYITAWLARDQLDRRVGDLRRFNGALLAAPSTGLVGDLMVALSRRAATMPAQTVGRAGQVLGDLLSAALSGTADARLPSDARLPLDVCLPLDVSPALRQDRVEAFILSRLADPALDLQAVVAGTGLSRTSVYRAFEETGGVAFFVRQQRLLAFRAALRRRGETRSIAALAHAFGFASESHGNRLFREAFGEPPGRFRAAMARRRLSAAAGDEAPETLRHWHSELY